MLRTSSPILKPIREKVEAEFNVANNRRVLSHGRVKRFSRLSTEIRAVMKELRFTEHDVFADFERWRKAPRSHMTLKAGKVTRKGGIIGDH